MKNLFTVIIIPVIIFAVLIQNAVAAKYNVNINVFSNDKKFSREPFSYYIDFGREIDPASVKMTISNAENEKTNQEVPVYVIPVAKYKAQIYFMPHKKMNEDSELNYILSFESGKWNANPAGSSDLKKSISISPNLIPNYSFERVEKAKDRFLTWTGSISVIGWNLHDYSPEFAYLDKLDSSCRVSTKEAFQGTHSLCFINGKARTVNGRNILVSGSASLSRPVPLKPNTKYKLGFFVKITGQIDNGMNFQGLGITLSFLDSEKRLIGDGGLFSAFYSISSIMSENYLNKWVYVEACDVTTPNTRFGYVGIAEKISGTAYVDMVQLREAKDCKLPEIIIGNIVDVTPKPVLKRANGTPVKI